MLSKIGQLVKSHIDTFFIALCFILIAFISFNLGKIAALEKSDIVFGTDANIYNAAAHNAIPNVSSNPGSQAARSKMGKVVGSINSDKYHYEYCSGAKRISEQNQVWFNSAQEAEKAGYVLAGNCQ